MLSYSRVIRQKLNSLGLSNYSTFNNAIFNDLSSILTATSSNTLKATINRSNSILENAAQDASSYPPTLPSACITPRTVDQVIKCVEYCYKNDVPIVPVGNRTGLEGGIHAMHGGVSFDMSHMCNIIELNSDDIDCHVEAGLSWRELNERIKTTGLWFPVDPGASASLGGMSATSASGTNAVKYGTMRENVMGLSVVVKNGEFIQTAGSEGVLGVITSVRLRLHALPSCMAVATVAFPDVTSSVSSVVRVMQCGVPVARIEFLDQPAVAACYSSSKLPNLDPNRPMLFVELHSLTERGLEEQVELLKEIFDENNASKFSWSSKQEERSQLWKARHELHWSVLKTKPGFSAIDTDACVPISKFPEMVQATHDLISEYGVDAPLMGHAGDGNFHSMILYDPKKSDEFRRAKELANAMGRVAIKLEGTVTGEHGVGRGKMDLLSEQFSESSLDTMHLIKSALDPKYLFNPDKMFKLSAIHESVKRQDNR